MESKDTASSAQANESRVSGVMGNGQAKAAESVVYNTRVAVVPWTKAVYFTHCASSPRQNIRPKGHSGTQVFLALHCPEMFAVVARYEHSVNKPPYSRSTVTSTQPQYNAFTLL